MLTAAILLITVFILPLLLEVEINENVIMIGLVEVFIIGFFSTLLDFNYLHDTRKYGYYLSKPYSKVQRLNMTLLVNGLFSGFFIFGLWFLSQFILQESTQFFLPYIGWFSTILFLIGLASVLSGNTLIAAIATWYNFATPLMILGVIYFALDILSEVAVGFSTSALMDYVVSEYYRLDIIYFEYFYDTGRHLMFLVYIIPLLAVIYGVTLWALKHRRNECIGDHLVFKGYQYYVALMASLIVPFIFTSMMPDGSVVTKLIAFVLLASITYYVAIVILVKSFKIEKQQLKVLIVFLVIFILFVMILGFALKQFEKNIPESDEIHAILVTNSRWFYDADLDKEYKLQDLTSDMDHIEGLMIFKDQEGIELIRDLHESIVNNPSYHSYVDFNIIYELKDGSRTRRYFHLEPYERPLNDDLDTLANALEIIDEYRLQKLPFVYDTEFALSFVNKRIRISTNNNEYYLIASEEMIYDLMEYLKMDIEAHIEETTITLSDVVYSWYTPYAIGVGNDYGEDYGTYISLSFGDKEREYQYLDLPSYFVNTRAYVESLIEENK
jgi:hypothetical protein